MCVCVALGVVSWGFKLRGNMRLQDRLEGKIKGRDSQIARLNGRLKYFDDKLERKDVTIAFLLRELNEALEMIYKDKNKDTAEQMLQDYLSDNGMYNEKVGK